MSSRRIYSAKAHWRIWEFLKIPKFQKKNQIAHQVLRQNVPFRTFLFDKCAFAWLSLKNPHRRESGRSHFPGPQHTVQEIDPTLQAAQEQLPKLALGSQGSTQWNQPPLLGHHPSMYQDREWEFEFIYKRLPRDEKRESTLLCWPKLLWSNLECVIQSISR